MCQSIDEIGYSLKKNVNIHVTWQFQYIFDSTIRIETLLFAADDVMNERK